MAFIKCSGGGGANFTFVTLKSQSSSVNLKNNSPFSLSESLNNYKFGIISFAPVSNNVVCGGSNYSCILLVGLTSVIISSSPWSVNIPQGGGNITITVTVSSTSVSFTTTLLRTLYVYGLK